MMGVKRLADCLGWAVSTTLRRLELAERRGFVSSVVDGRGRGWSRSTEHRRMEPEWMKPKDREVIERRELMGQWSDTCQDEVVEPYGEDYGKGPVR